MDLRHPFFYFSITYFILSDFFFRGSAPNMDKHQQIDRNTKQRRYLRARWEKCPMRGLRVPEISAGDFFKDLA